MKSASAAGPLALPPFVLFFVFSLVNAICYYPDGTVAPQDTACSNGEEASACCGQGYACLSNNICMSTGDEIQKGGASTFVRGSCTDQTWRSNNCPQFCINPDYDLMSGGEGVGRCPNSDNEWYCIDGLDNTTNCGTQSNVLIFFGTYSTITTIGVAASTSSASTTTSATSATTTTASTPSSTSTAKTVSTAPTSASTVSVTATAASQPSHSGATPSSSHTLAIALGVAIPLGMLILALLAYFVFRKKKSKERQTRASYHEAPGSHPPSYIPEFAPKSELPGNSVTTGGSSAPTYHPSFHRYEMAAENSPRLL